MNNIASKLAGSVRQAKAQADQRKEPEPKTPETSSSKFQQEISSPYFPAKRVWPD